MYKLLFFIILLLPNQANSATFYYFTASWCNPCKQFKPMLHQPDMAKLIVQYDNFLVDIDEEPQLKKKYNIRSVPTVVIVDKKVVEGKELETVLYKATYPSKQALKSALVKNLPKKGPVRKFLEKPVKFFKNALDN